MNSLPGDGNNTGIMEEKSRFEQEEKLKRAKKRVDEIKGFYIHLTVYLVINTFIMVNIAMQNFGNENEFWSFPTFVTPFFWGVGLAFHALHTFQARTFLGKKWEERMIQKYIEKDKQEANKYK
ncbi:2TM domain-containing protein [Lentiprolixibacter aurantiacus]|uniref:2TM domain-containing protein n=1 Tax=Lentiprolixibacter aurantiacus TaxID=2993939 RepID=A0AAE3MLY5_9FLAO|nr:2TM domain-containing protein [Lentiprolixibacter aurantiacus]MCX2720280.1 2TM domain-containing protein [Lentiprolixibacter aurantiacus]